MSNIEILVNKIAELYNEVQFQNAEYYLGIGSDLKEFGTIESDKLDQYNELLKQYNIKIEVDPEEENYFIVLPIE